MHLQSYSVRAEGKIRWKKVDLNHQRKAEVWFCNNQLCYSRQAWQHLSIQFMSTMKRRGDNTSTPPLQESNAHMERLAIYANTNLRSAVE